MRKTDQDWLTTGQAARLCSVTPSTVLNWLRKGRLEGVRTAGGHYRISREQLDRVLPSGHPFRTAPGGNGGDTQPLRCWEYFGGRETVPEGCHSCVVYRLRAKRCFRMAVLGEEIGHARQHCPTSCEDCVYFRRVAGLPAHVLVVTRDAALVDDLEGREDSGLELRIARTAYEASAAVPDFRPAFAVLDEETNPVRDTALVESLAHDRRLPGLKIIVATAAGSSRTPLADHAERHVARRIEKPFGTREITAVVESFPVEQLEPEDLEILSPYPKGRFAMTPMEHADAAAARNSDGFLKELSAWNRSEAVALADEHDIGELTDDHWKVIEYVQWYYHTYGKGPSVIHLHQETGMTSQDICELFPCGMVKGAYRLAGLPRPPGCV